ncbi:C-C motif chemokine 20 [Nothobranchius furzeri]|uniref:C-C motif chemokine 20-like n=1 Tax=Nothobranchius furzeri TaxID=105023 RepID=A0A9D2XMX6_NOTFU|nr:C-C motif chemokine 20 [Nothobranchius furzeri]KAF7205319.1 C-C motif chemokine 20-like [Nothobranchius furzeri]
MASRAAALILLGLICFEFAAAQIPVDCCLSITEKRLPSKNLVSYTIQEAGKGCDISATVFLNRRNMKLCAAHPEGNAWVKQVIKTLEKRRGEQQ